MSGPVGSVSAGCATTQLLMDGCKRSEAAQSVCSTGARCHALSRWSTVRAELRLLALCHGLPEARLRTALLCYAMLWYVLLECAWLHFAMQCCVLSVECCATPCCNDPARCYVGPLFGRRRDRATFAALKGRRAQTFGGRAVLSAGFDVACASDAARLHAGARALETRLELVQTL